MKTSDSKLLAILAAILLPPAAFAQVNSGSDGHDGALNPTNNLVIDMADHPDGIYHYTAIDIPAGVTVAFIPNAANTPVTWLVQTTCVIQGTVDVSAKNLPYGGSSSVGLIGGPGGGRGGNGGVTATNGQGLGGGNSAGFGGSASFGTIGTRLTTTIPPQGLPGATYGNNFILPLVGGSGGGGSTTGSGGGGGGGGAILIAASQEVRLVGVIAANGGNGSPGYYSGVQSTAFGGGGSGGAVRLVTTRLIGTGSISVGAGGAFYYSLTGGPVTISSAGQGRVRLDTLESNFGGSINGPMTQGFQPIVIPVSGQGIQLGVASLAGVAVSANPSGVLANPDVIIPAQQTNPIPVVVNCTNIPLNTEITVIVHPANGPDVQAVGLNNAGTLASSTATVSLNMPRGGGIIYAKAVTGIGGTASVTSPDESKTRSFAETGWTADGERFAKMEITAALGGAQQITYITESGKRYSLAAR